MDGKNVLTRLHTKTELKTSSQLYPMSAMFFVYDALMNPVATRTQGQAGRRDAGSARGTGLPYKQRQLLKKKKNYYVMKA